MQKYNLVEIVHNKKVQNAWIMNYMHEPIIDNLIQAFMQTRACGSLQKGPCQMSLKAKVVAQCDNSKLLATTMKSYPNAEELNTRDYALEEFELFGSTNCKFDLPLGFHCPNKVKCSIPCPNTRSTKVRMEETFRRQSMVLFTQHQIWSMIPSGALPNCLPIVPKGIVNASQYMGYL